MKAERRVEYDDVVTDEMHLRSEERCFFGVFEWEQE